MKPITKTLLIPRSIFPQIPYQLIMSTRTEAWDYHSMFLEMAMMGCDLDDAYTQFESTLDEVDFSNHTYEELPNQPSIGDNAYTLTELYGEFYADWYHLMNYTNYRHVEYLENAFIIRKLAAAYAVSVPYHPEGEALPTISPTTHRALF